MGAPGTFRSVVAIPSYGSRVELVQPIDGPSIYTTFLERRGPGLHHIGYYVPALEPAREQFRARGFEEVMMGGGHGVDGDGAFVFYDFTADFGSYVELISPPARRFPAHFEIDVDP
jgi:hypothetical protein